MNKTILIQNDIPVSDKNVSLANEHGWEIKYIDPSMDRSKSLNDNSSEGWNLWIKPGEVIEKLPVTQLMKTGTYSVIIKENDNEKVEPRVWYGEGVVVNPAFEYILGVHPLSGGVLKGTPPDNSFIKSLMPVVDNWRNNRKADREANYYHAICTLAFGRDEKFASSAKGFLHLFGRDDQESNFLRYQLSAYYLGINNRIDAAKILVDILSTNIDNKLAWHGLADVFLKSGSRVRSMAMLRNAEIICNTQDHSLQE